MRQVWIVLSAAALMSSAAMAQDELPQFTFNLGAGFTTPVETAGERLDRGWNLSGGAGVNFTPYLGALVQLNYNHMGVNQATLNSVGFPDGTVSIWSATLNPIIHLTPRRKVDAYLIGGGGFYQWRNQFTQPAVQQFTAFDPYFGVFYPVAVPVNQVITEYNVNKFGWNGGFGLSFGAPGLGKARVYSEARFHRMLLGANRYVDMIPVTFGLRF